MSEKTKKEKTELQQQKKKSIWTTDKIMSTSALFISVISLIALLYQSYLAREENRMIQKQQSASVLPHLHQWYSDNGNNFKLIVGNKGVGPAFIKNVEIVLDSSQTFHNTNDLFDEIFRTTKGLDTIPYVFSNLLNGFVLTANETINLIEINQENNINRFKQGLSTRTILFKITYEDVYGTQWLLSNLNENENQANVPVIISEN